MESRIPPPSKTTPCVTANSTFTQSVLSTVPGGFAVHFDHLPVTSHVVLAQIDVVAKGSCGPQVATE